MPLSIIIPRSQKIVERCSGRMSIIMYPQLFIVKSRMQIDGKEEPRSTAAVRSWTRAFAGPCGGLCGALVLVLVLRWVEQQVAKTDCTGRGRASSHACACGCQQVANTAVLLCDYPGIWAGRTPLLLRRAGCEDFEFRNTEYG